MAKKAKYIIKAKRRNNDEVFAAIRTSMNPIESYWEEDYLAPDTLKFESEIDATNFIQTNILNIKEDGPYMLPHEEDIVAVLPARIELVELVR